MHHESNLYVIKEEASRQRCVYDPCAKPELEFYGTFFEPSRLMSWYICGHDNYVRSISTCMCDPFEPTNLTPSPLSSSPYSSAPSPTKTGKQHPQHAKNVHPHGPKVPPHILIRHPHSFQEDIRVAERAVSAALRSHRVAQVARCLLQVWLQVFTAVGARGRAELNELVKVLPTAEGDSAADQAYVEAARQHPYFMCNPTAEQVI